MSECRTTALREYAGRWIKEDQKALLIPQIGEGLLARMAIDACDEIDELKQRLAAAEAQLSIASHFCDIRQCRGCDGYYPHGYVCACGEDNSYEPEAQSAGGEG